MRNMIMEPVTRREREERTREGGREEERMYREGEMRKSRDMCRARGEERERGRDEDVHGRGNQIEEQLKY